MNYYPQVKTNKSFNKNSVSNVYSLSTTVRLKHEEGFYYLVKYSANFNDTGIDLKSMLGTPTERIWNNLWQQFIFEVENLKINYQYNSFNRELNPIDPYQGEIDNYNPKFRFHHYDPTLNYDELVELNTYMKTV